MAKIDANKCNDQSHNSISNACIDMHNDFHESHDPFGDDFPLVIVDKIIEKIVDIWSEVRIFLIETTNCWNVAFFKVFSYH